MISTKCIGTFAVLALSTGAPGQEQAVEQRIAELIRQLGDADQLTRDTAVHHLVDLGRPAASRLRSILEQRDSTDLSLLPPLGRMGPDAVDCLPLLMDAFEREEDPEALTAICHAILGIAPFVEKEGDPLTGETLLGRGQETMLALMVAARTQRADTKRVELARTLFIGIQASGQVADIQTDVGRLTTFLDACSPRDLVRPHAAVRWLGRAGSAGAPALGFIHARLLVKPSGAMGQELLVPFAEAILLIDPSSLEAIDAHVFLVEHGDAYQQKASVLALRHFGDRGHSATLPLARVAADPAAVEQTRFEAVVTLGVIGAAARGAIPTLEKLAGHEDPQIAERAKAALRQIRRREAPR